MENALYSLMAEIIPMATGIVLLYYSVLALRRLGWSAFKYWMIASILDFIGLFASVVSRSHSSIISSGARHKFWLVSCALYGLSALIGTFGTVVLIRKLLLIAGPTKCEADPG
jgi:hypothetical protein